MSLPGRKVRILVKGIDISDLVRGFRITAQPSAGICTELMLLGGPEAEVTEDGYYEVRIGAAPDVRKRRERIRAVRVRDE